MKDHKYRDNPDPPVPFHAMCNAMAATMHAEIRVLHSLLKSEVRSSGKTQPQNLEELITAYIEEI